MCNAETFGFAISGLVAMALSRHNRYPYMQEYKPDANEVPRERDLVTMATASSVVLALMQAITPRRQIPFWLFGQLVCCSMGQSVFANTGDQTPS